LLLPQKYRKFITSPIQLSWDKMVLAKFVLVNIPDGTLVLN